MEKRVTRKGFLARLPRTICASARPCVDSALFQRRALECQRELCRGSRGRAGTETDAAPWRPASDLTFLPVSIRFVQKSDVR